MQDIRKPYSRSKSNRDISSRVEQFESNSYSHKDNKDSDEPVRIPGKTFRGRRNINQMDMYPVKNRSIDGEKVSDSPRGDIVYRDPRTHYVRRRASLGTWIFIITILVISGGIGLFTYVFNRATVTIVPKYQDVEGFRKTITFGLKTSSDQSVESTGIVPFIVATTTVTKTKVLSLSETKKVQSKASGKIIIYNNFDSSPQKLIKNTRFESTSGKTYRINQSITVPGKNGTTPGSIEVTVYADSYGTSFNSSPTDFTIPGFKGTPRYKLFFARSDGSITGGASGDMSLASLSDVNAAKDELAIESAQQIKSNLAKVSKDGYIGLYNAVDITYDDNEQDVLNGVTSTYQVTATGYLMLASAPEFAKVVASSSRDYKGEPVRLSYTETLNYTRKDTDRVASSTKLDILVEGIPRVIWLTDEDILKGLVLGKKRDEFKPIMRGINSIESAEIGFSPLWLLTFPTEKSKISVIESLPKR